MIVQLTDVRGRFLAAVPHEGGWLVNAYRGEAYLPQQWWADTEEEALCFARTLQEKCHMDGDGYVPTYRLDNEWFFDISREGEFEGFALVCQEDQFDFSVFDTEEDYADIALYDPDEEDL